MNEQLMRLKRKIVPVLRKHKVRKAGIFGSYARGEQTKKSDVDILVEFNGSLLGLVAMERELKVALRRKVDLLTYKGIHPLLKKIILKEEVQVL